jgi:hypothetical protein
MITKLNIPPFLGSAVAGTFRFQEGLPYATWWGRELIRSCSELPGTFTANCGAGKDFQANDEGYIVWVGPGNTPADGITKNLWAAQLPAAQGPWGQPLHWGMPILLRDSLNAPKLVDLGSALPKYRIGASTTLNYRNFFAYAQLDGDYGRRIWNEGRHWSLGDFMTRDEDQGGKSLGTAKPLGYYWRTPSLGTQGFYDVLGPSNVTVETASYMKLREVNLSYNIGQVRGTGDWMVGLTGRNLKTWSNYTGWDPEVGRAGGTANSGAVNGVDAYTFPNLRTFTLAVSTKF